MAKYQCSDDSDTARIVQLGKVRACTCFSSAAQFASLISSSSVADCTCWLDEGLGLARRKTKDIVTKNIRITSSFRTLSLSCVLSSSLDKLLAYKDICRHYCLGLNHLKHTKRHASVQYLYLALQFVGQFWLRSKFGLQRLILAKGKKDKAKICMLCAVSSKTGN